MLVRPMAPLAFNVVYLFWVCVSFIAIAGKTPLEQTRFIYWMVTPASGRHDGGRLRRCLPASHGFGESSRPFEGSLRRWRDFSLTGVLPLGQRQLAAFTLRHLSRMRLPQLGWCLPAMLSLGFCPPTSLQCHLLRMHWTWRADSASFRRLCGTHLCAS